MLASCGDEPPPPPPEPPQQLVRIEGSDVLGDQLIPGLAEAFLQSEQASGVRQWTDGRETTTVSGVLPGDIRPTEFVIRSTSAPSALDSAAHGDADFAMVVRPAAYAELAD